MIPALTPRDIKGLTEKLGDILVGDWVRVLMHDKDRHGTYVVAGEVYHSKVTGNLAVCSQALTQRGGKPSPLLRGFEPTTTLDEGDDMSEALHGDLVSAIITPVGNVKGGTITGTALAGTTDDLITVAGFILEGSRVEDYLIHDHQDENAPMREPATVPEEG